MEEKIGSLYHLLWELAAIAITIVGALLTLGSAAFFFYLFSKNQLDERTSLQFLIITAGLIGATLLGVSYYLRSWLAWRFKLIAFVFITVVAYWLLGGKAPGALLILPVVFYVITIMKESDNQISQYFENAKKRFGGKLEQIDGIGGRVFGSLNMTYRGTRYSVECVRSSSLFMYSSMKITARLKTPHMLKLGDYAVEKLYYSGEDAELSVSATDNEKAAAEFIKSNRTKLEKLSGMHVYYVSMEDGEFRVYIRVGRKFSEAVIGIKEVLVGRFYIFPSEEATAEILGIMDSIAKR